MSFGITPTSTTTLGANQFPVSAVAVPNELSGNLTALEGGPESTDSNGNKTAPASMYIKDGNDITLGTSTDANTINSVMGRLTKIRDLLNATLTVAGTVTEANSGAIKTDLDNLNTVLGTIADAAWSGAGNGSAIAILKKIEAVVAATLAVSGSVTANAGTNLNTSLLALESGGHLANVDTNTAKIPAQGQALMVASVPVTIASDQSSVKSNVQINGTAATGGNGITNAQTQRVTISNDSTGQVTANAGTNLNTSALALESGGNLASAKIDLDEIALDTDNLAGMKTDLDTLVPGVQGWIAVTGVGTASQDDALTFANQVRRVVLLNQSSVAIPFECDVVSTANSPVIYPGQTLVFDNVLCTAIHIFPPSLVGINTAGGLYVRGWK